MLHVLRSPQADLPDAEVDCNTLLFSYQGSGRAYLWFLGIFMLLAIVALSWLALALEVLETPPVLHDAMMRAGIPTR